jgi:hypothetical protein
VEEFPATEAAAMTADDTTAPPTAEPSEPEPELPVASGIEPEIVAAEVFGAAPAESPAPVTEQSVPADADSAEPVPADTAPDLESAHSESAATAGVEPAIEAASAFESPSTDTSVPSPEEQPSVEQIPAEQVPAVQAPVESALAEPVTVESEPVPATDAPTAEATPADQEAGEALPADNAGEPGSPTWW